jgi:hypothetical protein
MQTGDQGAADTKHATHDEDAFTALGVETNSSLPPPQKIAEILW